MDCNNHLSESTCKSTGNCTWVTKVSKKTGKKSEFCRTSKNKVPVSKTIVPIIHEEDDDIPLLNKVTPDTDNHKDVPLNNPLKNIIPSVEQADDDDEDVPLINLLPKEKTPPVKQADDDDDVPLINLLPKEKTPKKVKPIVPQVTPQNPPGEAIVPQNPLQAQVISPVKPTVVPKLKAKPNPKKIMKAPKVKKTLKKTLKGILKKGNTCKNKNPVECDKDSNCKYVVTNKFTGKGFCRTLKNKVKKPVKKYLSQKETLSNKKTNLE
jgi:hypothetical protein